MNLNHCKKIIRLLEKNDATFKEMEAKVDISRGTLIRVLSELEDRDCIGKKQTVGHTLYGRPPYRYYLKSQCICL